MLLRGSLAEGGARRGQAVSKVIILSELLAEVVAEGRGTGAQDVRFAHVRVRRGEPLAWRCRSDVPSSARVRAHHLFERYDSALRLGAEAQAMAARRNAFQAKLAIGCRSRRGLPLWLVLVSSSH